MKKQNLKQNLMSILVMIVGCKKINLWDGCQVPFLRRRKYNSFYRLYGWEKCYILKDFCDREGWHFVIGFPHTEN